MIYWPLMAFCKKTKILFFFSSAHSSPFIYSERDHSFTPLDPRSEAMAGIIFRACGFPSSSPSRSYVYCTDRMSFRFPGLHFLLLGVYEPQGITYCCLWSRNIFFSVAHVWYLSVRTCNQFREIAAHLFWLEFFLQKNGYRITGQKSSDLTLLVFCTLQPCLLYPPPVYFNKVFRSLKIRSFKETIPVGKLNTSSGNLLLL